MNLKREVNGYFDNVLQQSRLIWETELSAFTINHPVQTDIQKFYTFFYKTLAAPTKFRYTPSWSSMPLFCPFFKLDLAKVDNI